MRHLLALLALLLPSLSYAGMEDCYKATCRISTGGGTGCVYAHENGQYFVLTNAHVAGTQPGRRMRCLFNLLDGWERPVTGTVVFGKILPLQQGYYRDLAVISIPDAEFERAGFRPSVIPFSSSRRTIQQGETITSVGCPGGELNSWWVGHVTQAGDPRFTFTPDPVGGRSGSAIFNRDGTEIIGLLAWGGGGQGVAQTVAEIYRAMNGLPYASILQPSTASVASDAQADVVLLDFHASWCAPCQAMKPTIHQLVREGYPIRQVDIDQEPALKQQYNVNAVPTLVLVVSGREVWRAEGGQSAEAIRSAVKQCCDGQSAGGSCPTPGGGMMGPPPVQRPPSSGGGDFNPFPKPPAEPSNPAPPSNSLPGPAPSPAPSAPVAPQPPAAPACDCEPAKPCRCDNEKLICLIEKLTERVEAIDKREPPKCECPKEAEPQPPEPPATPAPDCARPAERKPFYFDIKPRKGA
jgi:thiol-disulfide isomerase/thioredoxin